MMAGGDKNQQGGKPNAGTVSGKSNAGAVPGGSNAGAVPGGSNTGAVPGGSNSGAESGGPNTEVVPGGSNAGGASSQLNAQATPIGPNGESSTPADSDVGSSDTIVATGAKPPEMPQSVETFQAATTKPSRTLRGRKQGQCLSCNNPDDDDMVACDTCARWYHFACVGVDQSIENVPWNCNLCERRPKRTTTNNTNLALAKLEEKRKLEEKLALEKKQLQEKRDADYLEELRKTQEEFLDSKFEILSQGGSIYGSVKGDVEQRTGEWVEQHSAISAVAKEPPVDNPEDEPNPGRKPSSEVKNPVTYNKAAFDVIPGFSTPNLIDRRPITRNIINRLVPSQVVKSLSNKLSDSQIIARLENNDLPEFSGSSTEWPVFISIFTRSTERCGYTDDDNIRRLEKCLKGDARNLVKGRLKSPNAVKSIIDTLYRNYGQPKIILDDLMEVINKFPTVTIENMGQLAILSASVEDLCDTVENNMLQAHLNNPMLLNELTRKLPLHLQHFWGIFADGIELADLAAFNKWLITMANGASHIPKQKKAVVERKKAAPESNESKTGRRRGRTHTVAAHTSSHEARSSTQSNQPTECKVCNKDVHDVSSCQTFLGMSKRERWLQVQKHWLCRICLKKHPRRCSVDKKCGVDGCTKYHHALLHAPSEKEVTDPAKTVAKVSVNYHQVTRSVLYRVIPVFVYGPTRRIKTLAFIDEGSSITLVENSLAEEIGLDGPRSDLCLRWTGDVVRTEENSRLVSFELSGVAKFSKRFTLRDVNTVQCLGLPQQTLSSEMLQMYCHTKGLPIATYAENRPTIIIGLDQYRLVPPLKTRVGNDDEPIAVKTPLGWTIYGACQLPAGEHHVSYHRCECRTEADNKTHARVEEFFSLENFGILPGKKLVSKDDSRAVDIMTRTSRYVGDRYQIGLLWKHDNIRMPNSRDMALRRMLHFEAKLKKNPDLQRVVNGKIKDYLAKGYAEKIDVDKRERGLKTWYLPLFSVQNPNKPSKIRLVFDAAAKSRGVCLNDYLLTGPDMLVPLLEVLFKFRENPVAISGDIREMYHQVLVEECDRDSQRFLWRFCEDDRDPEEFLMRVMVFGATCSPTCAQFIKNINAKKYADDYPRAVEAIQSNHYVDDWLDSFETTELAIEIADQVKKIHAKGGFEIRNWRSNDDNVLNSLGGSCNSEKNLLTSDEAAEKVLGMVWCTRRDVLIYRINPAKIKEEFFEESRAPTKRQVLSIVMSVFDPLGLISPILVHGKVILQEIWKAGLSWDEQISGEILDKWQRWLRKLIGIESLEIPRSYVNRNQLKGTWLYDLHIFCDAGGDAHAAVAYARICNGDQVDVVLIAAKTRVNPAKVVSVPRLELLSAVLAVRLMKMVKDAHRIKFADCTIWSDSTTVLDWLKSDARKYKQFVAFRICECLESTDIRQWRYIYPYEGECGRSGNKMDVEAYPGKR